MTTRAPTSFGPQHRNTGRPTQIDYVLVDPRLREAVLSIKVVHEFALLLQAAQIGETCIVDHAPVYTTLRIPSAQEGWPKRQQRRTAIDQYRVYEALHDDASQMRVQTREGNKARLLGNIAFKCDAARGNPRAYDHVTKVVEEVTQFTRNVGTRSST